jgi:uncharacterized protein YjiS (DUF1127 family)
MATAPIDAPVPLARPAPLRQPALGGVLARLVAWDARFRERRRIAELTNESLRDAGWTRGAARREAAKAFWRA